MANNYTDSYDGIATGAPLSAAKMTAALNTKEKVANKKDTITAGSSTEYPSSKAVTDALGGKQDNILGGTAKNIVAYSGTAGTFSELTRVATTMETSVTNASDDKIPTEKAVCSILNGTNNDIVHKSGMETITNVKTFGTASAAAEPVLGKTKTTDAENDGAKFATEAQVYKKQDKLTDAQLTLLNSLGTLSFFPKGTILAFSKTAWEDDTSDDFRRIWKVCNAANHAANSSIPDLTNKFLRGGNPDDYGATGNGQKTLSINEIPAHSHTGSAEDAGSHRHDFSIPRWTGDGGVSGIDNTTTTNKSGNYIVGHNRDNPADAAFNLASSVTYLFTGTNNISEVSAHAHTLDIDNSGGGQAFDVVPAYYTVIYIMKIV
ncbi:MAG: hypothetical protein LBK68_04800 [Candidatus Margulisbacteria bacterium]|jgi:hypothetical protein|nr:hypothetical protein [Candidatus Margulisiibacteriota bacterium]